MHRILLSVAALLVAGLGSLLPAGSVVAGEYYDGGYVSRGASYSSNCCYRKVVRTVRTVRYVRVDDGYRHGYYGPRYRSSYYAPPSRPVYYGEPYRSSYYYGQPYRYDGGDYYGGYSRVSYGGYGESCTVRRVRVADGYGGWVWARSRVCY